MNQVIETKAIELTERAAQRISAFLQQQPQAVGFKVDLKKYGCSGWGYDISLPKEINDTELTITEKGITIIIPKSIIERIEGTVIDFEKQGINQVFTYTNPQATGECGCGESFTTG